LGRYQCTRKHDSIHHAIHACHSLHHAQRFFTLRLIGYGARDGHSAFLHDDIKIVMAKLGILPKRLANGIGHFLVGIACLAGRQRLTAVDLQPAWLLPRQRNHHP
jgi:hypothetical protein